ncbi:MAG TPA: hypothetical protein VHX36_03155 [Candidatus Acidoferrales bacterium]|nr:hypothetical protein [Candidatus Acidoferrales bacterium]
MNQQLEKQVYAGVVCRCCRQAIPLPSIVVSMVAEIDGDPSVREAAQARVFSLRCRACDKEMPYRVDEIVDFEGAPRARVWSARRKSSHTVSTDGLSRAASA